MDMDRRGQKLSLYNCAHYGYEDESESMYFSMPLLMSNRQYMLLFDNAARGELDVGKAEADILQFEARGGRTAYQVIAGDSYPALLKHYTQLTGTQPIPPRWAFGNYASRFGYRNRQQVEEVVDSFIRDDIPLDTLVLDLYWFGPEIVGHMGNLDWDLQAFPEPEEMMRALKQKGIKTVLITEPFILTSSKKWQDAKQAQALVKNPGQQPKQFDCFFGHTGLVDVFSSNGQQWFAEQYQRLFRQGVSGWWGDLGEPEVHPSDCIHTLENGEVITADEVHNAYGHKWAEMLYRQQIQLAPKNRPFIMMRSGFAGSQRYGMLPWTGDVHRSWAGFQSQVGLGLQMSLMGMGYIHSDLGGFAEGETFDPELYLRWLQYGVFQPIYRPHGQEHIAPEPVFHDDSTKDIARKLVKLRYQLLAYNYTLAYEYHVSGMPLMRPLFFERSVEQIQQNCQQYVDELMDNCTSFMWGEAFHVTPVTQAGAKTQKVFLTPGVWFDFWTDQTYLGDGDIELAVSRETFPVMVRAGAFIPMVPATQSTEDYSSETLILHYYHDDSIKQARGQMFEDDGNNPDSIQQQAYRMLHFGAGYGPSGLVFSLHQQGMGYPEETQCRCVTLILHGYHHAVSQVRCNGDILQHRVSQQGQTQRLECQFQWQGQEIELELEIL